MLEKGITVTELSPEEKQKFKDAVQPLYEMFEEQKKLIERIQMT